MIDLKDGKKENAYKKAHKKVHKRQERKPIFFENLMLRYLLHFVNVSKLPMSPVKRLLNYLLTYVTNHTAAIDVT